MLQWIHSVTGVPALMCAAVAVGLLVAVLYFRIIFGSFFGFWKDVENDNKIPLLDKDFDYVESRWSHDKILIWILVSAGAGALAYNQLPSWFPNLFR